MTIFQCEKCKRTVVELGHKDKKNSLCDNCEKKVKEGIENEKEVKKGKI